MSFPIRSLFSVWNVIEINCSTLSLSSVTNFNKTYVLWIKLRVNWFKISAYLIKTSNRNKPAHSAEVIITFNHWVLSPLFAGFSPQGLIYPPSSWGKISFTRQIAERASPTGPYKSFFNQRPLRLGAHTRGSTTVTPQTPPSASLQSLEFLSSSVSSSGLSAFVSVIRKLRGMTCPALSALYQHPSTSSARMGSDDKEDQGRRILV